MTNPTTPAQADQIELDWILANVDLAQARRNFEHQPRPNSLERHRFTMPPLGTWRMDQWGEIEVLVEIPVAEFQPSEGEWEFAINYPETRKYIEWQRAGYEPPPLNVIRTNKGNLRSCNRRRWLAAREAGVRTLKCWYSPTHPERCASPKWQIEKERKH